MPVYKYNYSGIDDMLGGLEFTIPGWSERKVDVLSLNIEADGSYSGTLRFIFKDNFGLNDPDVEQYGKYHDGFKSWFILQHYDEYNEKYKPFKTVVKIDYPISGKIKGYKK